MIALFGPGPLFKILATSYDASQDDGSNSYLDLRIDSFVLQESGRFLVGVSTYGRHFVDGGTSSVDNGDYMLVFTRMPENSLAPEIPVAELPENTQ